MESKEITCQRGFKTKDEVFEKIATGPVNACNGCPHVVTEDGIISCRFIMK